MKYLSVCSGIEAATVAWHPLGWTPVAFSEIDPFPSAVLAHHYPDVPNLGDMTNFKEWPNEKINVLVGGTPCQSFSVAGLRKGLADPRGNLALTYLAIADRYRPRWLVWENVPGVLSSGGGRDFGSFLGALEKIGYGFAYRVLDAQYFRLAQRRRRVFVVGSLGGWRRAAAVLFERASLSGHPAPSREAGQTVATPVMGGAANGGAGPGARSGHAKDGTLIPIPHADISPAIKARDHKGVSSDGDGDGAILVPMVAHSLDAFSAGRATEDGTGRGCPIVAHSLRASGFDASEDGTGRGTPLVPVQPMTLAIRGRGDSHDLEYRQDGTANAILTPNGGRGGIGVGAIAFNARQDPDAWEGRTGPLDTDGTTQAAQIGMRVRRLTPREYERLQGFPDDYTLIPYRGKPAADWPRYKALGNSMAVPVMRWIGVRIAAVTTLTKQARK